MSLSRLPDEVLQEIFWENILEDTDLCDLALVSRRFSRLIRPSLYREIEVDLPTLEANIKEWNNKYQPTPRYQGLMRTLTERPDIGSNVRCIYIASSELIPDESLTMKELFQKAKDLVRRLPALRSLDLCGLPLTHSSRSIFDNTLHQVHDVLITYGCGFMIYAGMMAMSLPKINKLKMYLPFWNALPEEQSIEERVLSTSPLKILEVMTVEWKVAESNLFRAPKALKTLTLKFGHPADFYPELLVRTLNPLRSNLVNLHLEAFTMSRSCVSSDLSVGDFRSFACLKCLWISEVLCFRLPPNGQLAERQGFYNRLPLTIGTLQIDFSNFVFHEFNADGRTLAPEHDYEWVTELAENKSERLPQMRTVSLIEHGACGDNNAWEYPTDIKEAFETAAIDLRIIIKAVKGDCCQPFVEPVEIPHSHR